MSGAFSSANSFVVGPIGLEPAPSAQPDLLDQVSGVELDARRAAKAQVDPRAQGGRGGLELQVEISTGVAHPSWVPDGGDRGAGGPDATMRRMSRPEDELAEQADAAAVFDFLEDRLGGVDRPGPGDRERLLPAVPAPGCITLGSTWYLQTWYRAKGGLCGKNSNVNERDRAHVHRLRRPRRAGA